MINWILNAIGILFYFIQRFARRTTKTKFNLKFWLKDNFPELISVLLLDLALMILLMQPETQVNLDNIINEYVPFGLQVAVKPATSLLIGLIFAKGIYEILKKIKYGKK